MKSDNVIEICSKVRDGGEINKYFLIGSPEVKDRLLTFMFEDYQTGLIRTVVCNIDNIYWFATCYEEKE